jgi:hypothetical protein
MYYICTYVHMYMLNSEGSASRALQRDDEIVLICAHASRRGDGPYLIDSMSGCRAESHEAWAGRGGMAARRAPPTGRSACRQTLTGDTLWCSALTVDLPASQLASGPVSQSNSLRMQGRDPSNRKRQVYKQASTGRGIEAVRRY